VFDSSSYAGCDKLRVNFNGKWKREGLAWRHNGGKNNCVQNAHEPALC
jgi:hypothetical protein